MFHSETLPERRRDTMAGYSVSSPSLDEKLARATGTFRRLSTEQSLPKAVIYL
jgi:hypothetical protein